MEKARKRVNSVSDHIRNLEVGEGIEYPVTKTPSIKATLSGYLKYHPDTYGNVYTTKIDRQAGTITVLRLK